ncbi:MAG: hypothetical protein ABIH63_03840 [archaeon]
MKILIQGLNEFYGENVRLVKTLMKRESLGEYPDLMKWKLQMSYFDGNDWIEICRIDNYLHENQVGSHIHNYKKKGIKRVEMTFEEAEKNIKNISQRILKEDFGEDIKFE